MQKNNMEKKKTVGIDWDGISITEARKRRDEVESKEKIPTLLFETRHGYHIKLFFDKELTVKENFKVRKRYNDCKRRLDYSARRYSATGQGYDILFNMKQNHWRTLTK